MVHVQWCTWTLAQVLVIWACAHALQVMSPKLNSLARDLNHPVSVLVRSQTTVEPYNAMLNSISSSGRGRYTLLDNEAVCNSCFTTLELTTPTNGDLVHLMSASISDMFAAYGQSHAKFKIISMRKCCRLLTWLTNASVSHHLTQKAHGFPYRTALAFGHLLQSVLLASDFDAQWLMGTRVARVLGGAHRNQGTNKQNAVRRIINSAEETD